MDNHQNQLQCSPCFPINSETFTFNSSKLKSIQTKMHKTPLISSPLCLQKQSPSDQIKETLGSNSQLSLLLSPREPVSLSFKDLQQKSSPFMGNRRHSSQSQSLNDFKLSNSSEPGSSSRNNQRSPYHHPQMESKDKQFLLPNTKYSMKHQEEYTIIEDPHEDSFQLRKLKTNPLIFVAKKDFYENESKRMIKELLKLSNSANRIDDDYHIGHSKSNNSLNCNHSNSTHDIKEGKTPPIRKGKDDCTCSTEDNEEELDEETKLLCFLSIPRLVYKNKQKQLMCFSLCGENAFKFNPEADSLSFKNLTSMAIGEKIPIQAIMLCERKSNQQFIVQYIHQKTFLKKAHTIETKSIDDCLQYVSGINLLLLHKKILHS